MEKRPLGTSGIEVSCIGLGTWAMGATVTTWGHIDDRESIAAIQQALDSGINLIDTAPIYGLGHAEKIVGRAIQGRRHEVVLATKCGLMFPRSPTNDPPRRCLRPDNILRECDASLRRLGTDVIDLYLCHWPDPQTPMRETMEAMTTLLAQGKIRAIGLSNFDIEQILAGREFAPIHAVETPFSMLTRRAGDDLIPFCARHEIGVLAYSPLTKGLLTGKFSAGNRFRDVRARDPEFTGDRYRRNLRIVEALRPIADKHDRTLAQLATSWVLSFPGVTAPLVGAKRPSQVLENVGGAGWSLDAEDRARIDEILKAPP